MKLNLSMSVQNLDGSFIKDNEKEISLAKILAGRLMEAPTGIEALKAHSWANKLYNDGEIDIDLSDLHKLKSFVEQAQLFVIVKAPLLQAIMACELSEA